VGLKDVNLLTSVARLQPVVLSESQQVQLSRQYQGLKYLQSANSLQLPIPSSADGVVSGQELIAFAREVFEVVANLQREEM
jgi:hypothetical protein